LECSDEWQENGKDKYIIRLRKEINDIRGMILLGHSTFEHNPVENSLEYNQLVDVSSDEATHGFVIENNVLLECVSKCITKKIMQAGYEYKPGGQKKENAEQVYRNAWRHDGIP